jgi:hypothetical protein
MQSQTQDFEKFHHLVLLDLMGATGRHQAFAQILVIRDTDNGTCKARLLDLLYEGDTGAVWQATVNDDGVKARETVSF